MVSLMIMFVHYMKSTDWLEKLACDDSTVEIQTKAEELNRSFPTQKTQADMWYFRPVEACV